MAGSLNKVTLLGNLARDPEIRQTSEGHKIVNFPVATSEQWRDKNTGERKERAEFHRVVIFNERLADVAERFLKKGTKVYLEGQLTTRKWVDQQGQDRYATEVVLQRYRGELLLLGGRPDDGSSSEFAPPPANTPEAAAPAASATALGDLDDDVPF